MDYNIHMNKNIQGFTLIELIVTLAVIGVLFAMAAPNLQTTVQGNRLSGQYNDMRGDFAFARNLAITRNVAVTISSNNGNDWSNGWVVVSPTGNARISKTANNVVISSTIDSLTYNPDGTCNVSAPTAFKMCDDRTGAYGKELNVVLSGRVNFTSNVSCP